MKKLMIFAIAVIALTACNRKINNTVQTDEAAATADTLKTEAISEKEVVYVCPMHPEVTGKKGDKCPKCEMDLVEKK
jgi:heavy metal-binding protein